MLKRFLFVICLNFLLVYTSSAQIPTPPISLPSPVAYSFTQSGLVPVNNYSGLPDISIPIANFKYKNFEMPIKLSYDYSGFKPNVHPGPVGMNWSLNIGGAITRTIRGLPDEFRFELKHDQPSPVRLYNGFLHNGFSAEFSGSNLPYSASSLLGNTNSGNASDFEVLPHILPYVPSSTRYKPADRGVWWLADWGMASRSGWYTSGVKDIYADEFNFNMMGYSGKFMFEKNGKIVVQCNRKVRIEKFDDDWDVPIPTIRAEGIGGDSYSWMMNWSFWDEEKEYPKTISGFRIIGDDGTIFFFGKNTETLDVYGVPNEPTAIEYSINGNDPSRDYWKATAWFLTRVLLPDGKKIDFDYSRKFITSNYTSYLDAKVDDRPMGGRKSVSSQLISTATVVGIRSDLINCNVFGSPTKEMKFEDGTLNNSSANGYFELVRQFGKPTWYKVDSLNIKMYNQGEKNIEFLYDNTTTQRLRLQSVREVNKGVANNVYQFAYDDTPLPLYGVQTDHWGFWNGKNVLGALPVNSASGQSYYAAKQSDYNFAKAGMLTKITYPTGGYSMFRSEPNVASKIVKDERSLGVDVVGNEVVGGLRIEKISSFSFSDSPVLERKYYYLTDYDATVTDANKNTKSSSGVLNSRQQYFWSGNFHVISASGPAVSNKTVSVISEQPLYNQFDNHHVGYSEVTEVLSDGSYTKYSYTNHDNGYQDDPILNPMLNISSPYVRYSDRSFERGLLKAKREYSSGGILQKEMSTTYKPSYLNSGEKPYRGYGQGQLFFFANNSPYPFGLGNSYKFYTYRAVEDVIIEKIYAKNGLKPITTQSSYFYDSPVHEQVTRIETLNSNGDKLTTYNKYAGDLDPNANNYLLGLFLPNKVNYSTSVIQKIQTKTNTGSNDENVISSELYEYNLRLGYTDVILSRVYSLDVEKPFKLSSLSPFVVDGFSFGDKWTKDARYREVMHFVKYDVNKNAVLYVKNDSHTPSNVGYDVKGLNVNIIGSGDYEMLRKYAFETFEVPNGWPLSSTVSRTGSYSFSGDVLDLKGAFLELLFINLDVWAKGPNIPTVTYNGETQTTPVLMIESNGWKLYRYRLYSPYFKNIRINSNGCFLDDIKATPITSNAGIKFNTYTYSNGLLVASSNETENLSFYEYDNFKRLKVVKDQDGHIVKSYDYNSAVIYRNSAISKTFRKDCPAGETGTEVIYTVEEGKYSSTVDKATADRLARNDIDANGQGNANKYGTCINTCTGNDQKVVNGVCETGRRVNLNSRRVGNYYICTYRYEWTDGTHSANFDESNSADCAID